MKRAVYMYLCTWPIFCLLSTTPMQSLYLTHFGWFPTLSCGCITSCTNIVLTPFGLPKPSLGFHPAALVLEEFPPYSSLTLVVWAEITSSCSRQNPSPLETLCAGQPPLWCLLHSTGTLTDPLVPFPLNVSLNSYLAHALTSGALGLLVLLSIHAPFLPCSTISHWLF